MESSDNASFNIFMMREKTLMKMKYPFLPTDQILGKCHALWKKFNSRNKKTKKKSRKALLTYGNTSNTDQLPPLTIFDSPEKPARRPLSPLKVFNSQEENRVSPSPSPRKYNSLDSLTRKSKTDGSVPTSHSLDGSRESFGSNVSAASTGINSSRSSPRCPSTALVNLSHDYRDDDDDERMAGLHLLHSHQSPGLSSMRQTKLTSLKEWRKAVNNSNYTSPSSVGHTRDDDDVVVGDGGEDDLVVMSDEVVDDVVMVDDVMVDDRVVVMDEEDKPVVKTVDSTRRTTRSSAKTRRTTAHNDKENKPRLTPSHNPASSNTADCKPSRAETSRTSLSKSARSRLYFSGTTSPRCSPTQRKLDNPTTVVQQNANYKRNTHVDNCNLVDDVKSTSSTIISTPASFQNSSLLMSRDSLGFHDHNSDTSTPINAQNSSTHGISIALSVIKPLESNTVASTSSGRPFTSSSVAASNPLSSPLSDHLRRKRSFSPVPVSPKRLQIMSPPSHRNGKCPPGDAAHDAAQKQRRQQQQRRLLQQRQLQLQQRNRASKPKDGKLTFFGCELTAKPKTKEIRSLKEQMVENYLKTEARSNNLSSTEHPIDTDDIKCTKNVHKKKTAEKVHKDTAEKVCSSKLVKRIDTNDKKDLKPKKTIEEASKVPVRTSKRVALRRNKRKAEIEEADDSDFESKPNKVKSEIQIRKSRRLLPSKPNQETHSMISGPMFK